MRMTSRFPHSRCWSRLSQQFWSRADTVLEPGLPTARLDLRDCAWHVLFSGWLISEPAPKRMKNAIKSKNSRVNGAVPTRAELLAAQKLALERVKGMTSAEGFDLL